MAAYGGAGANIGGAGTVYTKLTGENGLLAVDNGGQSGTNTLLAVLDETIDVLIKGNAGVMPSGAWSIGNLTIASNGLLLASSVNHDDPHCGRRHYDRGGRRPAGQRHRLRRRRRAWRGPWLPSSPRWPLRRRRLRRLRRFRFSHQRRRRNGIRQPGHSERFWQRRRVAEQVSIGGSGGGAIAITCLSGIVQVDGTLSANGGNGSGFGGGGGSGGTIVLTGGTLLGSGSITASGGNGANSIGGGGGGGRMAISLTASLFGGTISAYGGGGGNWGGAGTVFILERGQTIRPSSFWTTMDTPARSRRCYQPAPRI